MQEKIKQYYTDRMRVLSAKHSIIRKNIRIIAWLRLLMFGSILYGLFGLLPRLLIPGLVLSLIALVIFLLLIKYHLKSSSKLRHNTALLSIGEKELQALGYNFTGFGTGEEFIDPNHAFSFDMDLFGENSVFQFINRTTTFKGKKFLADILQFETLDTSIINKRQEAIAELSGLQEELQDFRAAGSIHQDSEQDIEMLNQWLSKAIFFIKGNKYTIIAKIMPPVTLLSIVMAVFIPTIQILPIILYLINLLIVGRALKRTNEEHNLIGKRLDSLKKYAALLEILERNTFESQLLKNISETLISGRFSAYRSINKLSKLVSAFDNRMNLLAALFLEGILLWDIQCMIRLEKWRRDNGSKFNQWLTALAEFDVLTSLATYAYNHPDFNYPMISSTSIIETIELGHILIPESERICNDFQIKNESDFIIITGANMAGKSTFLRTVATSMIIAMAGAPVCAKSFLFRPMPLFSSMRTSDSLNKHESYFYAELKRLKEMLERLRNGEAIFIILDEILKGTNSYDKQKGSFAALEQIIKYKGTGIIATHDLELAKIENKHPSGIKNLCFETEINQAKISFDYKLRNGITSKMNASILMKQMGIIE